MSSTAATCPINSNTFPGKLWRLVNGGRFQSIGWSNGGTCIAIDGTTFKNEVLYNDEFNVFKTQNFSSFVRQLNLYGFRKLAAVSSKDSNSGEDFHHFQNPYFNLNRPELLVHVRRTSSSRRRGGGENSENFFFTTSEGPNHKGFGTQYGSGDKLQTYFHHQGITYAPVKSPGEQLRDVNRISSYCQKTDLGQVGTQSFRDRSWAPVAGGGMGPLQGLSLVANTTCGSLTATSSPDPQSVVYPTMYNQYGQLKKFVVIQEEVLGQCPTFRRDGLQNLGGIPRSNDILLSTSCDPMMCAVSQQSPPSQLLQQPQQQTFIVPPSHRSPAYYHTMGGYPVPSQPLQDRNSNPHLLEGYPSHISAPCGGTSVQMHYKNTHDSVTLNHGSLGGFAPAVSVNCGDIGAISSGLGRTTTPSNCTGNK